MSNHSAYAGVEWIAPAVEFEPPCVIQAQMLFDGPLSVGAFSGIFGGRLRRTNVGRYCSIAPGLQTGWDEHPVNRLTSSMVAYVTNVHGWAGRFKVDLEGFKKDAEAFAGILGQTRIGNDVWLGLNVFIRSGVTVGDGAIVGAGAHVMRDLAPYGIYGGNPAKLIRMRFSEQLIERLLRVQWWRFNLFDIPPGLLSDLDRALDWVEEHEAAGRIREYHPTKIALNAFTTEVAE